MLFFKNIIIGIFIGAGAIIPGVSSGVICVILGIYEKLLDAVLNLTRNFKQNIKLILPISFGAIIGIIVFGRIIKYLLYQYPVQISFLFMGLVIGSIPKLLKQTNKNEKFKLVYIVYMLLSMFIGIGMVILERKFNIQINENYNSIYLFIAGICMSIGVIVPGVSSTVILMILGVYNTYLDSISNVYLPVLFPIMIGLTLGSLICMKLIKYLFNNYYAKTFYSIIGVTIGSVFVLYTGISLDISGIISILCFILGCIISSAFEKSPKNN